ncbi:molybdopterin-binding oxidoreductase [Pseudorhodoferax sp. Leaf274]|uniref:molybdopterin-binding oxidoreductase n=1 Tax=Pseudorhodoferax sp. Leaf274 TaxID=1736318 RepID=UPI0007028BDA|nr:molybdopterin-binding oxidoreductase [Pseudorhodoferax sp. Leaf274]KQP39819.1 molybdopterin-binding oxidoreductase [Pseudorhodoferax sp. Leaf274]
MSVRIFSRGVLFSLAAGLALAACGGGEDAATVRIDGALDRPASLGAAALGERPAIAQNVAFTSGNGTQQRSYVGADLWSLLSDRGIQTTPGARNDQLNRYLLATGADGYRTVFALGELSPTLGNKGSMLAYLEKNSDGTTAAIGAEDGPFRVTAPGDVRGGRYVSQLVRLDVRPSGSTAAGTGGGVSPSVTVAGAVATPMAFDLTALQALPASTVTVGNSAYTGVSLWNLLNTQVGLKTDASIKNPLLSMYAVATGSDGYKAMVSVGEIHPSFGNRDALVAYAVDGALLDRNGMARLVVPGDARASRHVSNLVAIEVFAAPAAP